MTRLRPSTMRFRVTARLRERFNRKCREVGLSSQDKAIELIRSAMRDGVEYPSDLSQFYGDSEINLRYIPLNVRVAFKIYCARNHIPMRGAAAYLVYQFVNE